MWSVSNFGALGKFREFEQRGKLEGLGFKKLEELWKLESLDTLDSFEEFEQVEKFDEF